MANAPDHTLNDFSVELNIVGRDLDPETITRLTGLEPTTAARTGDPRPNRKGGASYDEGVWCYEVTSSDEVNQCRDHQLVCVIDAIEPHMDRIREAGAERVYFYFTLASAIGMMNMRFKAETMRRLASLDADLYVSCFDCFNPNDSFWHEDGKVENDRREPVARDR